MAMSGAQTYWHGMKDKAERNLAAVTGMADAPLDEAGAKSALARAMRHGTYAEAADAIGEYAEWAVANLMLRMHDATVGA